MSDTSFDWHAVLESRAQGTSSLDIDSSFNSGSTVILEVSPEEHNTSVSSVYTGTTVEVNDFDSNAGDINCDSVDLDLYNSLCESLSESFHSCESSASNVLEEGLDESTYENTFQTPELFRRCDRIVHNELATVLEVIFDTTGRIGRSDATGRNDATGQSDAIGRSLSSLQLHIDTRH